MESLPRDWLHEQCAMLPAVRAALLLVEVGPGASPAVAASWPDGVPVAGELIAAARLALDAGRPSCLAAEKSPAAVFRIAAPLEAAPGRRAAVAATLAGEEPAAREALARLVAGGAWLGVLARRERAVSRTAAVLDLLAEALEERPLRGAATALATELAVRLGLERVSLGFARRGDVEVAAVSHSAHFDARSQLLRETAAAMEEAIDQDATIAHPPARGGPLRVSRAHEALAARRGSGSVFSVPLVSGGAAIGALSCETGAGAEADPDMVLWCEDAASLLGPILQLRRRSEAGWLEAVRSWLRACLEREPRLRIALAGLAVALVLLPGVVHTEYRVRADATLEGLVQRAVVARIDGYIAEASARPGDAVREGQLLGRLDARDLELEQHRFAARLERLRREQREARAQHDRSQAAIASARSREAEAELRLLREQLARTRLVAPFDGIVVGGDLGQLLGSPVEKGQVLFEIASLDGYRIILAVDERDIAHVAPGDSGRLALSALPGELLPVRVQRVTPVAIAADGHNRFRVEATLEGPTRALRPGMQGVAKLSVGRRRLAWIWTHGLLDWLRLRLWAWWI